MGIRASVTIAVLVGYVAVAAQDKADYELARLLADDSTRQSAVAKILASGSGQVPILLSWTSKPPPQVDTYGLYIGLADVFGQLKTKEAIPFLVKNISLSRTRDIDFNPWMKMPEAIESTFPAVAALIQIGPDASRALIHHFWEPTVAEDRVAAIFVVSRIKGVPEARTFLTSVISVANMERYRAEEGLKLLVGRH